MRALKFMLQAAGPTSWWILVGTVFAALIGVFDVFIIKTFGDVFVDQASIALLLTLVFLRFVLDLIETSTSQGLAKQAAVNMSECLHEHFLMRGVRGASHNGAKLAQLLERAESAFESLERSFYSSAYTVVAIGGLLYVVIDTMGLRAGAVCTGLLIAIGLLIWWLVVRYRVKTRRIADLTAYLKRYAAETFDGLSHIAIHGTSFARQQRYSETARLLKALTVKAGMHVAFISAMLYLTVHIMLLLVAWQGVGGTAAAAVLAAHLFRARALIIASHVQMRVLQRVGHDLRLIAEDLEDEMPLCLPQEEGTPSLRDGSVVLQHATLEYGGERVVDVDELEFSSGSTTVIMGPTGSGKSSLRLLVSGIEDSTSGRVLVGGVKPAESHRRCGIAAAAQTAHRFSGNVRSNLLNVVPGHEVSDALLIKALVNAAFPELVDKLDREASQVVYSTGERWRFELARCLLKIYLGLAHVFIADEMTANLDAATELEVVGYVANLCRQQKITCIIITHNTILTEVAMAERVIHMKNGKVDRIEDR